MPGFQLPADRPALMGILNVTPDSFSDGGRYFDHGVAVERGLEMVAEGADLIDVGGESTRPTAEQVDEHEELRRVLHVVRALSEQGVSVSIDTSKSVVAEQCLDVGAVVVNDVSALGDPKMGRVCAKAECTVCLMHRQGDPMTMQVAPRYDNVVEEVRSYLLNRANYAADQGIETSNLWLDPGIGFGKTLEHNLALIKDISLLTSGEFPVLIGVSRKSMIGRIIKSENIEDRLSGGLCLQMYCQMQGVRIMRTHDCKESMRVIKIANSLMNA